MELGNGSTDINRRDTVPALKDMKSRRGDRYHHVIFKHLPIWAMYSCSIRTSIQIEMPPLFLMILLIVYKWPHAWQLCVFWLIELFPQGYKSRTMTGIWKTCCPLLWFNLQTALPSTSCHRMGSQIKRSSEWEKQLSIENVRRRKHKIKIELPSLLYETHF